MKTRRIAVTLKLCALLVLVAGLIVMVSPRPESVESAFPGANGKIAFTSERDGNLEIYVMNSDGSGQTHGSRFAISSGTWADCGPDLPVKCTTKSDRSGFE